MANYKTQTLKFIISIFLAIIMVGCIENIPPTIGPCDDTSNAVNVVSIESGSGAQLIQLGKTQIGPFLHPTTISVYLNASRRLKTDSGISGTIGATASYNFVRLYQNGSYWMNINSSDDLMLPIEKNSCLLIEHRIVKDIVAPAGVVISAESVWSIVKHKVTEDTLAITDNLMLNITN